MKITLKKLSLINFKGIKNLVIEFNTLTNIFGENATGKTTVMDSFLWLLFGKDSSDRKDFEIKTLTVAGKAIEKIDHEVTGLLDIDGEAIEIKRILREKWQKKRGSTESEFTGNETLYYWNEVPMQAKEFAEKISGYVAEGLFKLITNPLYFNSLPWEKRRSALMQIAGTITDSEIAANNKDFTKLLTSITNKSMDEYKREVAAKKKKLKDDIESIPTRVDEVTRQKPTEQDWQAIEDEITLLTGQIVSIDNQLTNKAEAQKQINGTIQQHQQSIFTLQSKAREISFGHKSRLQQEAYDKQKEPIRLRNEIKSATDQLALADRTITAKQSELDRYKKQKESLYNDLDKVDAETLRFNEGEFICPACKRELDEQHIYEAKQTLTENFNTNKADRLAAITKQGLNTNEMIAATESALKLSIAEREQLVSKIQLLQSDLNTLEQGQQNQLSPESELNDALQNDKEYNDILNSIKNIEAEIAVIQQPASDNGTGDLRNEKQLINLQLDDLKKKLNTRELIAAADARIEQLQKEETSLAQQIADLESTEYTIAQFSKAKIETMEQRINSKFTLVKFKMFDTQINGGEIECCTTLVNGVPFSDANNASKVNAGIDIINALCTHYGVYAPIFIDNRESVNQLLQSGSQIVNLIVSSDKTLRVA